MPTPTAAFADVAATYGDIDPEDIEAVQAWFVEELPKLSPDLIERALHELLAEDGALPSRHVTPVYPKSVRLPSLLASPTWTRRCSRSHGTACCGASPAASRSCDDVEDPSSGISV